MWQKIGFSFMAETRGGGKMVINVKTTIPEEENMLSGHVACLGCGAALAMRYALKALGKKTVVSIPACCWAVIPGVWPRRNLEVPLVYTAFEVTGSAISGVKNALDAKGMEDVTVMGWAGDGGTADIGIQSLSGAVDRDEDVIYVMYDNEAYMNTGIQRSGSTPPGTWTTTTPVGVTQYWEKSRKKNVVEMLVGQGIKYAATASVAYPEDFIRKLQKAKSIKGTKYIQVFSPCPTGWKVSPELTVELSRLVVETGAWPLYEVENGVYTINVKPDKLKPIKEYLKPQGRFRHLPDDFVEKIQKEVEREWEVLLKKEEFTKSLPLREGP